MSNYKVADNSIIVDYLRGIKYYTFTNLNLGLVYATKKNKELKNTKISFTLFLCSMVRTKTHF